MNAQNAVPLEMEVGDRGEEVMTPDQKSGRSQKATRAAARTVLVLGLVVGLAWPNVLWAQAAAEKGENRAPEGFVEPLATVAVTWGDFPMGLAFDFFSRDRVWIFHANSPDSIWPIDIQTGIPGTPLPITKLGGSHVNGGAVRLQDGAIFASDSQGDASTIGDNIYLFDRSGATIAFWELSGGFAGQPCSGEALNNVWDVAIDPGDSGTLWATVLGQNLIYPIDVSDESGSAAVPSPCVIGPPIPAPPQFQDLISIAYDPCSDGYWLGDNMSGLVQLVANDGTFNTVLLSLGTSNIHSTGITYAPRGYFPYSFWTSGFLSMPAQFEVFDAPTQSCDLFADGFESGDTSAWSMIVP